jgi:hypothetical protein
MLTRRSGFGQLQRACAWALAGALIASAFPALCSDVVFVIGENEYDTARTLPEFARQELAARGITYQLVSADARAPTDFRGIEALRAARLLVLSVRRRTPPKAQLDLIRQHLAAGKPLVAIRTASHAFAAAPGPGESAWATFDADVLGGVYNGYEDEARDTGSEVWTAPRAISHPVLAGLEKARFLTPAWIYKTRSLASGTTVLMSGRWPGAPAPEPVAWTNDHKGARVFYTSLGHPGDFRIPEFRLLLLNAICWALERAPAGKLATAPAPPAVELRLQTRNAQSGQPVIRTESTDPRKVGVVVVDMWNYHHCMTAAQRVGVLVPRMNRVLAAARRLGMQVMFAPTDVAGQYAGTPQRERAMALPLVPVPALAEVSCPVRIRGRNCMCGPGIVCARNFGWDGMHPGLRIAAGDLITFGPEELYANAKARGITHLIYMGVHTNACILDRPEGMRRMTGAGLTAVLARDVTDALTYYDPATGFTPDDGTAEVIADIERGGLPSIDMFETVKDAEGAHGDSILEVVRMAPWGSAQFPYQFENAVAVALTAPALPKAEIRYTLDGSDPAAGSALYSGPIKVAEPARLRAAAFLDGRRVTRSSDGEFVRLAPMPPAPEVWLDQLKPASSPNRDLIWDAKVDESFHGTPLRVRGVTYARGLGMRAPSNAVYELKPEYRRFVAVAGVDDHLYRQHPYARFTSMHASVRFAVFIDGNLTAESPVMRLSQEPWRFDIAIPEGSRRISLAVTDAGSRSPFDLGDWLHAGFVLRH